jgi:hypothetical protein
MRILKTLSVIVLAVSVASCVVLTKRHTVASVDVRTPVQVKSAVKVHLKDGSTIVYPRGIVVTADEIQGNGSRHDLGLEQRVEVTRVPLGEVVGVETYRSTVNTGESLVLTTLATAAGVFATAALAVAIFGSCPTVYSADGSIEEAELFSSSIAPLFESRDLDRLRTQPDATGVLSLDIRNEAMETHYLNHLQLLEVTHAADEVVIAEGQGAFFALRNVRAVTTATGRDGRDVAKLLAAADQAAYETSHAAMTAATPADMDDWIDFAVPVQAGASSAAVTFRLRNSLLNTVLLYDVMLAPAGAGALDWMSGGLDNIGHAVELGRWHQRRSGLHVSVWEDGRYREVTRIPDSGPIAWHDVAAIVPVPAGETTLRVRVSFLADHWRIDQVGVSTSLREAAPRIIPLAGVRGPAKRAESEAFTNMAAADGRYLQTNPGHRFYADFTTGSAPPSRSRTFFLSSLGYYTEWIRGAWLQQATTTTPFAPTDDAIVTALGKWSATRDTFEQRFLANRVPVR